MVIRKVHNTSSRRVAPCYGFDVIAVAQHAWRAYALEVMKQAGIIAVIVFAATVNRQAALVHRLLSGNVVAGCPGAAGHPGADDAAGQVSGGAGAAPPGAPRRCHAGAGADPADHAQRCRVRAARVLVALAAGAAASGPPSG